MFRARQFSHRSHSHICTRTYTYTRTNTHRHKHRDTPTHTQSTFVEGLRSKAFHLMGQLYPEAAALVAQLLAFDPAQVVPQLLADVDRSHRWGCQLAVILRLCVSVSYTCFDPAQVLHFSFSAASRCGR